MAPGIIGSLAGIAPWAGLLAGGLLLPRIASLAPHLVESIYARRVYPIVASALNAPARRVPFCLAEGLAVLLVLGLILAAVAAIVHARMHPGVGHGSAARFGRGLLITLAVGVWAFQLLWGLNHARPPLMERLGLEPAAPSQAALADLVRSLQTEVERSIDEAAASGEMEWPNEAADRTGDAPGPDTRVAASGRLRVSTALLADRLAAAHASVNDPGTAGVRFAHPKTGSILSGLYTRIGISGMYSPPTGEATYNGRMPDVAIPATMAHEMAHQRGIAREDEANFLAWLACRESASAAARYSGALAAWRIALRAYASASPDSARSAVLGLDPRARRDLAAMTEFWRRHASGPASAVAERVNDAYLRGSGDPAGAASYDRAVQLLLAWAARNR